MAKAVLLAIGDELVSGLTVDTNSAYLAQALRGAGFDILRIEVVPDDEEAIGRALRDATADAPIVITTGGLGPTADDLTTACVARHRGVELVLDEDSLTTIEQRFRDRGIEMPPNNRKQAMFPIGAEILPNPMGTAPAFILQTADAPDPVWVASLPGVPREMRVIAEESLIPALGSRLGRRHLVSRVFSTVGLSESALDERLSDISGTPQTRISFRAAFPRLQVRLSTDASSEPEAMEELDRLDRLVRERLGHHVYATGDAGLEDVVGEMLRERELTVAVAESCTGGLIGHRITQVAGSSSYFVGGILAYSNSVKRSLLSVRPETLDAFGAVSEEVVLEMGRGVRKATGADIGLATSGIAGPGGGSVEKPVGTVAIAIVSDNREWSKMYHFPARSRDWIKQITAQTALDRLRLHFNDDIGK